MRMQCEMCDTEVDEDEAVERGGSLTAPLYLFVRQTEDSQF